MPPVAEGSGVTTGEGEFAETGAEPEGVPVGDDELAGLVLVVGFGVLVGLALVVGFGVVVGGDVEGVGEAEDGVAAGLTPTVAAGGGLMSR
jgi:hypothetical protein